MQQGIDGGMLAMNQRLIPNHVLLPGKYTALAFEKSTHIGRSGGGRQDFDQKQSHFSRMVFAISWIMNHRVGRYNIITIIRADRVGPYNIITYGIIRADLVM